MNRASLKGMSFTMSSPDEAVQGLAMPDEGGHAPLQRCERAASTCSTPEDTQHRLIHLLQSRGAMFTSGRSPLKGCGVGQWVAILDSRVARGPDGSGVTARLNVTSPAPGSSSQPVQSQPDCPAAPSPPDGGEELGYDAVFSRSPLGPSMSRTHLVLAPIHIRSHTRGCLWNAVRIARRRRSTRAPLKAHEKREVRDKMGRNATAFFQSFPTHTSTSNPIYNHSDIIHHNPSSSLCNLKSHSTARGFKSLL
jgi:hypothetical protein